MNSFVLSMPGVAVLLGCAFPLGLDFDYCRPCVGVPAARGLVWEARKEALKALDSKTAFDRYIGIDYSGAETPTSSHKGLRVYSALQEAPALEVSPPAGPKKYWTRRGIAEWLVEQLKNAPPTLIGVDHGFSFPAQYFEAHRLPPGWAQFLDDFQRHWPTDDDHTYVDFVRDGVVGNGALRMGNTRWRRLTEQRAGGAKSVFHFGVPGEVAKSTHAGLPWLRFIRLRTEGHLHFWPFDGWTVPAGQSAIAEVYPAIWSHGFPRQERDRHQHDAFAIASWMREADRGGSLSRYFNPALTIDERALGNVEGWILGVA